MNKANGWIEKLKLEKHPEGGYFKEVYRSEEKLDADSLPARYSSDRNMATSIYFLLKGDEFSSFHRIQSDETWHFYAGSTLELFVLETKGKLARFLLGQDVEAGEYLQLTIPRNHWFGAKVVDANSYSLLGCTVAPGFHFDDFELANASLMEEFPSIKHEIIDLIKA